MSAPRRKVAGSGACEQCSPADGSAGPLKEFLNEFERALMLTTERKQARVVIGKIRRFLWAGHVTNPSELTVAAIEEYLAALAAQGRAPKTILNHLSAVSCLCRFLQRRGIVTANPCTKIRLRRPEQRLPRYLNDDEIREVLGLARAQGIWPEVSLALSTGLRLSELIRLRWNDVDVGARCLTVRKSKSRRPRTIPLCGSAIEALKEEKAKLAAEGWRTQRSHRGQLVLRSEAPLRRVVFDYVFPARQTWPGGWRYVDRPRASSWWLRALRPIKEAIPKFNSLPGKSTGRGWHLFRHTFASRLAQRGVSLYKIAQWLGHSDVRTTQIYAHLRPGFDEEIEKIGW